MNPKKSLIVIGLAIMIIAGLLIGYTNAESKDICVARLYKIVDGKPLSEVYIFAEEILFDPAELRMICESKDGFFRIDNLDKKTDDPSIFALIFCGRIEIPRSLMEWSIINIEKAKGGHIWAAWYKYSPRDQRYYEMNSEDIQRFKNSF